MKVTHKIEIAATPEIVWAVTSDIDRWPQWTPTVIWAKRIDDGPFKIGSRALIRQSGLPKAEWTVIELTERKHFVWETRVRGLHMIATHEVAASENGAVNTLVLETCGAVALLLSPFIGGAVRDALEKENTGLKKFCEDKASAIFTQ